MKRGDYFTGLFSHIKSYSYLLISICICVPVLLQARISSVLTADLDDVFALSASEAWVCDDNGTLLDTTDGGINWNPVALTGADLQGITFKDTNIGVLVGDGGMVFQTTNGGQSWTLQSSARTFQLRSVIWGKVGVVWGACRGGAAIRSIDNGGS